MVFLKKKEDCCGCSACVQVCPIKCIDFKEDEDGFAYPEIDLELCVHCNLCKTVCPALVPFAEHRPYQVYAVKNLNDSVRLKSSSGGVFRILAEKTLDAGGVVFGARFNTDWSVIHDYVDNKFDLELLQGAKYMQSRLENTFSQVATFLKAGKKVLFSGTPCQIAGLKKYLKTEYNNLLTVDLICHGVPSSKVWQSYLKSTLKVANAESIRDVTFRAKDDGWHRYALKFSVFDINGDKKYIRSCHSDNEYMKLFLSDLMLRPSCYNCFSRSGRSGADITLGDFWGVDEKYPDLDDDKGVSIVLVNRRNSVLESLLKDSEVQYRIISLHEATERNCSYFQSPPRPIIPVAYKLLDMCGYISFMKYLYPIYNIINKAVNKLRRMKFIMRKY